MNDVISFNYGAKEIGVTKDENGSPWWFVKDVCNVLGLSNPTEAIKGLDEDEKNTLRISEGIAGNPNINIINEPGLYSLIIRSNKPEAKRFKRWITHEVLPQIRKTGSYIPANQVTMNFLQTEAESAKQLAKTFGFDGNQALLSANKALKELYDVDCLELMGTVHLIADDNEIHLTATEIGKELGLSAIKANRFLESKGIQAGQRDNKNKLKWIPTEKGMPYSVFKDTGKQHSDGTPVQQLFWKKSILNILAPQTQESAIG